MASLLYLTLLSITALWTAAIASPAGSGYHKIVPRQDVLDEYDYVIVGGGTSGLTVGDRLTEDGKCVSD